MARLGGCRLRTVLADSFSAIVRHVYPPVRPLHIYTTYAPAARFQGTVHCSGYFLFVSWTHVADTGTVMSQHGVEDRRGAKFRWIANKAKPNCAA